VGLAQAHPKYAVRKELTGMVYCHFYQYSIPESLFQMYVSFMLPHLEYTCQDRNPYKVGDEDTFIG